MNPLRLLILFLCGCLLATGLLDLFPKGEHHAGNIAWNDHRDRFDNHFLGVDSPGVSGNQRQIKYTPPRWIKDYIAYDAAHPRIRRIVEWRVYDRRWKQVGVVYNGEIFNLEGERTGCLLNDTRIRKESK